MTCDLVSGALTCPLGAAYRRVLLFLKVQEIVLWQVTYNRNNTKEWTHWDDDVLSTFDGPRIYEERWSYKAGQAYVDLACIHFPGYEIEERVGTQTLRLNESGPFADNEAFQFLNPATFFADMMVPICLQLVSERPEYFDRLVDYLIVIADVARWAGQNCGRRIRMVQHEWSGEDPEPPNVGIDTEWFMRATANFIETPKSSPL